MRVDWRKPCISDHSFTVVSTKIFKVPGFHGQGAKKVVSDSPGLVDFAIGLGIFVLNLPDGQVLFFWGNSNYRRIIINPANQKGFWG